MRRGLSIQSCGCALINALLLAIGSLLNDGSLLAADRIAGVVRTSSGEPATAADVWVVEYQPADWPLILAKTKTDEHGEFAASVTLPPIAEPVTNDIRPIVNLDGPDFNHPPIKAQSGRLLGRGWGHFADPVPRCYQVWVRTATRQLGWSGLLPAAPSVQTTVVLQTIGRRVGVVHGADGVVLKEPKVSLVGLPTGAGFRRGGWSNRYCLMPREWSESFALHPNADGHFTTNSWPTGDVMVAGSADGFAECFVIWKTALRQLNDDLGPWQFRLIPSEPLRGVVRGQSLDDLPKPQQLILRLCEMVRLSDEQGRDTFEGFHLETTTVRGREFVFENAPKLPFTRQQSSISIASVDGLPSQLRASLKMPTEKSDLAIVTVYRSSPEAGQTLGRPTARQFGRVEGAVVDVAGKPVPDAEILVDRIVRGPVFEPLAAEAHTDDSGQFFISTPRSHDNVWVKARHGDLVSERVQIAGARLPGNVIDKEITLTLKPAATTRITGIVVDSHGRPLAARPVIVWREVYQESNQPREQYTHGGLVETLHSAPNGRFQSSPLWVGEAYFVQCRGAEGETVNSHKLVATAGSNIDVGRLIVPSRQPALNGRVVDSSGKPLAGALVNSADGTRSTTTDADGRFQLGRWSHLGEVLFVDHTRHRPAARIVREPDKPLVVRLFGRDERVPNSRVAVERFDPPLEFGSEIASMARLDHASVERAWLAIEQLRRLYKTNTPIHLTPLIGRLEPWTAVDEFRERSTGYGYSTLLRYSLARLAEENPDRALGALLRVPPANALEAAGRLTDWYATRDPEKAALFADRYLALIDSKSGTFNAPLHLARAGHWRVHRGQREEGFALLTRAAEALTKTLMMNISIGADGELAEGFLRIHSPALAQKVHAAKPKPARPPGEWDWSELHAETALTWLDHVESQRLVPPSFSTPPDLQILRQTAQADPATARRLAALFRSLRPHIGYRRTLVMLALWNQQAAWDVIDEDLLDFRWVDDEQTQVRASSATRFEHAARLLVAGSDVGYPDLDTLIANCVANRERVTGPPDTALRRTDSVLSGLAALTLFAPNDARPLIDEFRVMVPRHLLGTGFRTWNLRGTNGVCRADWYLILALTEPDEALRLLEQEVDEFLNHPPPSPPRIGTTRRLPDPFSGITTSADVWATPPEERWRFLANRFGW